MMTKKISLILTTILLGSGAIIYGVASQGDHSAKAATETHSLAIPLVETVGSESLKSDLDIELSFPGQLLSSNDAAIYPRREGQIKEWKVRIGSKVFEGQIIAILSAPPNSMDLNGLLAEKESARIRAQAARAGTAEFVRESKQQLEAVLVKLDNSRGANLRLAEKDIMIKETESRGADQELTALEQNRLAAIAAATVEVDRIAKELPLKKEKARSSIERLVYNSANDVVLIRPDSAVSPLSNPSEALNMQLKIGIGGATNYVIKQYRPALANVLTELKDRAAIPEKLALVYGQIVTELLSNSISNNDLPVEDLRRFQQDTADDRSEMIEALKSYTQAQTLLRIAEAELEKTKAEQDKEIIGAQTFATNSRTQSERSLVNKERAVSEIDVEYARARQDIFGRLAELNRELALAEAEVRAAKQSYQIIASGLQGQEVRAPKRGVISTIQKNVGDFVSPSEMIAAVSGDNQKGRFVRFSVASDLITPTIGDEVKIIRPGFPFSGVAAKISGVGQALNSAGNISAEAQLEEEVDWPIYSSVRVVPSMETSAIFVPLSALWWDDLGLAQVWLVNENNRLVAREVSPGRVLGNRLEILYGLEQGERFIVKATSEFKAGQAIDSLLPAQKTGGGSNMDMESGGEMEHGH